MKQLFGILLAMVMTVSASTVPAFAKSDNSARSGKVGKETSSAACDEFAAITFDQAKEIALGHAGMDSGAILDSSCTSSVTDRTAALVFMNRGGYYG